jgi:glyoxylase-like metal-dependent hydrolase (beta-lactamase superfamily II)
VAAIIERLTDNLLVCRVLEMSYNAGVFVSAGEACLIDPGLSPADMRLIEQAAGSRQARPRYIVLTHSHWDHVLGPEFFGGVPVVQQQAAVAVAAEYGAAIERQVAEWRRQSVGDKPAEFGLAEPDETFGERMELRVGDEALELMHAPGHAEEQLVVYHKASGTLWAGDMLSDIEIPFVMQSLVAYRATLDRLVLLDVRALVPGHGSPTKERDEIRARFDDDINYLAEVHSRVARAVLAGRTAREALLDCKGMQFRHRDDNLGAHQLNVVSAFYELGGREDPGVKAWSRLQ